MSKFEKELLQKALRISNTGTIVYNLYVNRRNGHYCVDKYCKDTGKYVGCCFSGNFNETKTFLDGMLNTIWLM